jgi:hypothetical protein
MLSVFRIRRSGQGALFQGRDVRHGSDGTGVRWCVIQTAVWTLPLCYRCVVPSPLSCCSRCARNALSDSVCLQFALLGRSVLRGNALAAAADYPRRPVSCSSAFVVRVLLLSKAPLESDSSESRFLRIGWPVCILLVATPSFELARAVAVDLSRNTLHSACLRVTIGATCTSRPTRSTRFGSVSFRLLSTTSHQSCAL